MLSAVRRDRRFYTAVTVILTVLTAVTAVTAVKILSAVPCRRDRDREGIKNFSRFASLAALKSRVKFFFVARRSQKGPKRGQTAKPR